MDKFEAMRVISFRLKNSKFRVIRSEKKIIGQGCLYVLEVICIKLINQHFSKFLTRYFNIFGQYFVTMTRVRSTTIIFV